MAHLLPLFSDAAGVIKSDSASTQNALVERDSNGDSSHRRLTMNQQAITAAIVAGVAAKTANYTLTATDWLVTFDATSGNLVATLPAVAAAAGQILTVKKIDASGNTVTVTPAGAETIDGSATKVISAQWGSYQIQSTGSAWLILAKI